MKNKQIFIKLVSVLLLVPVFASAAVSPGIKPGSIFYFFDTAAENIVLFFTFNPENKAKKALEYADERLAEAEASAEEKNSDAVKAAITNYESNIALASEESKQVKDKRKAEELFTSITDNALKQQEVLSAVLIKAPDEAKEAITKAIEVSKKGQEEAAKQVAELKGEVEQLKKEVESLKNTKVTLPVVDIKPQEQLKNSSRENTNSRQNYDQELSQMVAETRQRISVFNGAVQETEKFIPIVKTTINKYPGESMVQQSGQELINENNNLASISKKLVSIETERANKLSSYLGLGVIPPTDIFSQIIQQYNDYYRRYETSNMRIESLMRIFVANEKSALERKLALEKQDLEELKLLLSQEMVVRRKRLADLETKIEFQKKRYDTACEGVSMNFCAGQRAYIASHDLNPLIDDYNALLGNKSGKIYSPVRQTYLKFEADQFGGGGKLYDPNGSTYYTFDCDQRGNCSIYGN